MVKICKKCKAEKPLNDFYRELLSRDGFAASCKKCKEERKDVRKRSAREKIYYQKNKNKKLARILAKSKYGDVFNNLKCSVINCGDASNELHHLNYDFPLDVVALCSKHHKWFHDLWKPNYGTSE